MQAANLDSLNGRLLTERSKFAVQLTKQRKIRPGDRWNHEEQT